MSVELRNALKKRKPLFRNHNSHKIKRATKAYRKPRGIQSKMRLNHKGYSRQTAIGFGSPRAAHGMTRDGLKPVVVSNAAGLSGLESGVHGVVLASGLGMKKRAQIAQEAAKLKLDVVNCKDPAEYAKNVASEVKARHEKRESKKKKHAEAAKKAKPKKEKKEDATEENREEEKEAQKKELDKVLTTKE